MSHLGLCRSGLSRILDYAAFGIILFEIMSFGIVSHSGLCRLRDYVVRDYVAFGIMSHSGLCRIRTYVGRDYVVRVNVVRVYVVRHNVGVS